MERFMLFNVVCAPVSCIIINTEQLLNLKKAFQCSITVTLHLCDLVDKCLKITMPPHIRIFRLACFQFFSKSMGKSEFKAQSYCNSSIYSIIIKRFNIQFQNRKISRTIFYTSYFPLPSPSSAPLIVRLFPEERTLPV